VNDKEFLRSTVDVLAEKLVQRFKHVAIMVAVAGDEGPATISTKANISEEEFNKLLSVIQQDLDGYATFGVPETKTLN
jgi:hypothetical protein